MASNTLQSISFKKKFVKVHFLGLNTHLKFKNLKNPFISLKIKKLLHYTFGWINTFKKKKNLFSPWLIIQLTVTSIWFANHILSVTRLQFFPSSSSSSTSYKIFTFFTAWCADVQWQHFIRFFFHPLIISFLNEKTYNLKNYILIKF